MEYINLNSDRNIATLTIDRQKFLNALNKDLIDELYESLSKLSQQSSVGAIVLRGAGDKAFVAGADIKSMRDMNSLEAEAFAKKGQDLTRLMSEMPQILVAAVKGFALGGGCELAMACDLIYASQNSKFGQPEVGLGVIAGFGGTQRLTRAVGEKRAKELLLTGKVITAEEACSIGLVNQVWSEETFDAKLDEVLASLLKNGPKALWRTKLAINQGADLSLESALHIERQQFALCFAGQEQKEGMDAFLEKRTAKFR